MKNVLDMREKRAQLWEQAKALHDRTVNESRDFHADEQEQYDRLMGEIDGLKSKIDREERLHEEQQALEKRDGSPAARQGAEDRREEQKPATEREEYRSAYLDWVRYGYQSLNPEQRSLLDQGRQTVEARALSGLTGSAGGYTVPQGFYNSLVEAMKWYGGMRTARVTTLRTSSGNDLPIPTNDDTANVGAIVGESAAVGSATDPTFGQKILKAYKYTSKTFLVPIELLQDSAFDLEAYIRRRIAERIGRITNSHFTVGTGSSQPQGVVTGATLGKTGTTGQTTTVIYDDLVDLQHSVDIAYRQNSQWMFNDSTLKAVRKLKDSTGLPLWQPGLVAGEPDAILGKGYVINNDVAAMAAGAKSILFGDFSSYFIRDVMDLMIVRISEKYIENGQIGFVAFFRCDGQLIDAGQGPIRYYANSAS